MVDNAAHKLTQEIPDARRVRDYLESRIAEGEEVDPDLLLDMIEGETDLLELIDALYAKIMDDQILVQGLTQTISDLTARKSRITKTVESNRNLILMAMDRAGIKKAIQRPEATFSVRETPEKLEIVEEADIPAAYWIKPDPIVDKKTLTEKLKELRDQRIEDAARLGEGETLDGDAYVIPGAKLTDKGISLTIRVK